MRKMFMFVPVLMVLAGGCASRAPQAEAVRTAMNELMVKSHSPGMNFSIVDSLGNHYNYSCGLADSVTGKRMDSDRVLFSGSIGKTYAVAVLMQLVDEGRLKLSDRLMAYFPENQWLHRIPHIDEMTVAMLLQHTSGLQRYAMRREVWEAVKSDPDRIWTPRDRLSCIFDLEAVHRPGEGWTYSDTNYILIGMLIEQLTGHDYYDEVRQRILVPYLLADTFPAESRDLPRLAVGYSRLADVFLMPGPVAENGRMKFNPQMEWTGGGFACTTPDLARWAELYYSGQLFSDALLNRMVAPCEQGREIDEGLDYGMGSFIYHTEYGVAYGHTGLMPGFNAIFAWFPGQKMAAALQVNCDDASHNAGLLNMLNELIGVVLAGDEK